MPGDLYPGRQLRYRGGAHQTARSVSGSSGLLRTQERWDRGRKGGGLSKAATGDQVGDSAGATGGRRPAARRAPLHGPEQAPRTMGRAPSADGHWKEERRGADYRFYAGDRSPLVATSRDDHIGASIQGSGYDGRRHSRIRGNQGETGVLSDPYHRLRIRPQAGRTKL